MDLVSRVKNILIDPQNEWRVIDGEPDAPANILKNYVAIVAAIPVVCGQTPGQLKPALTPEHDVHQDCLRPELLCSPQRLSRGSGNADDAQALPFQAIAGGLQKQPVVVHNQDTERCHVNSVPAGPVPRIGASRKESCAQVPR